MNPISLAHGLVLAGGGAGAGVGGGGGGGGNIGSGTAIFPAPLYDGVPYSQALPITGGTAPFNTPAVATGALPQGLSLSIVGSTVVLSGTCRQGVVSNFTVSVVDSLGATLLSGPQRMVRMDQYFSNVISLLHGEGTNGSTFLADTTSKPWTGGSPASIDTAVKKFGNASILFNGTTSAPWSSFPDVDFNFGAGSWTMETQANLTSFALSFGTNRTPLCITDRSGNHEIRIMYDPAAGALKAYVYDNGGYLVQLTGPVATLNSFSHIAFVRDASGTGLAHYLLVDGVVVASGNSTSNYTLQNVSWIMVIGNPGVNTNGYFVGHQDEIRITKGIARYTGAYTVPQDAFPDYGLYTTLNPADIGPTVSLSNNNLRMDSAATGAYRSARSVLSKSTGKWYIEFTIAASAAGTSGACGLATAAADLSNYIGTDAFGWGAFLRNIGNTVSSIYHSNVNTTMSFPSQAVNAKGKIAVDLDAGKMWFGLVGTGWNGTGNPVTGANPDYTFTPNTALFVAASTDQPDTIIVNFGASAFTDVPPSGFNAGFYGF